MPQCGARQEACPNCLVTTLMACAQSDSIERGRFVGESSTVRRPSQEQVHVDPEDFTAQVACGARQIARTIRFRSHGGFCRRKIIEENKIREFQCRMNSSFDMRTNVWKSYQTLRLRVVAQFEDDATKKTNSPRPPR